MNNKHRIKKICDSWYHHKWFRVLLVLVGVFMLIFGITFALGLNILVFFQGATGQTLRVIVGLLYVPIAGYLVAKGIDYEQDIKSKNLVCQHCVSVYLVS